MELTVAGAADIAHTDAQLVQRALRDGALFALRRIGRTTVIDDVAATAWQRSTALGRTWTDRVRDAALELATTGHTEKLSQPERSRLKARLRAMTVAQFAHAAGGLGGTAWGRYLTSDPNLGTPIGPDAADLEQLGIVGGPTSIRFASVTDLDEFELHNDVSLHASGNLCVLERPLDNRLARILLDTYLLGGSRESAAAGAALERLCRAA